MLNNKHLSILISSQAEKYGERVAIKYRNYTRNCWVSISWKRVDAYVLAVARALIETGLKRGEAIAVFSQNKPECIFSAFGGYTVGARCIPFYATSSASQISFMANDAQIKYVFVGEQEQYDIMMDALPHSHSVERLVIFDKTVKKRDNDVISLYFSEFIQLGEAQASKHDLEIDKRRDQATYNDIADILYTSGTTGKSKGVIITYGMYHEAMMQNDKAYRLDETDVMLNFLPYSHIFERAFSYIGLAQGAVVCVNLRPHDILKSMQEVQPTTMSSVPRFWEKVYQGVLEKIENSSLVERTLMKNALEFGQAYWRNYGSTGITPPLHKKLKYAFYDKTIYRLLRKALGLTRPNFYAIAGAAVNPAVEEFVHAVGIYAFVGYGLTESTATVSCDRKNFPPTMGSVGRVIEGVEVKIGDNDEILLRGKTITPGYYHNEQATKEAIDENGWFHTGDAGYLKNGELFLKERIKDLFKTSNGKYIAPQMIESKLTIDRYVEQCVVVADQRKFVSALIVPNYGILKKLAAENQIAFTQLKDLCQHPAIRKFFAERINTLQQDLASYEKIKSFLLLDQPFTMENGELTNTLKIKRNVIYQHYAKEIDHMYAVAEQRYQQQQNK